jgi:hypothetical protein
VKNVFAAMKKFTTREYPQSMVATVLVEHAKSARINKEKLNP